jgi:hypothetical protein
MQVCAKSVTQHITVAHMLYIHSAALTAVNTLVMWLSGSKLYTPNSRAFRLLMLRILFSTLAMYMLFSAINCISISIINALWMTVPVWTPFSEWLVVGVPIPTILEYH